MDSIHIIRLPLRWACYIREPQTYRNMPDRRTRQGKIKPVRRSFRHIGPQGSMFGTNYISLREVTRLGLHNGQNKLFTEKAYLKK
jgi:hypothetical protein